MNDTKIMTDTLKIERAITGLTEWQKHVQAGSDIDRDISVAVEVLKARLDTDVPDMNVGDMISRQAAIEAVGATDWYSQNKNKDMVQGASSTKEAWYKAQDVYNVLKDLPSAQLGTNLAEVGTDCISRAQAIDMLRDYLVGKRYPDDGTLTCRLIENEVINKLPSAQPEIVRCKDCKHWIPYDWMFSEVWQSKNMADYPEDDIGCDCCDMAMKANDFCSRGEKREETT